MHWVVFQGSPAPRVILATRLLAIPSLRHLAATTMKKSSLWPILLMLKMMMVMLFRKKKKLIRNLITYHMMISTSSLRLSISKFVMRILMLMAVMMVLIGSSGTSFKVALLMRS